MLHAVCVFLTQVKFFTAKDKVNPPGDTLLLRNSPDGTAREGAMGRARFCFYLYTEHHAG